ncbi:MAG: glycosyltransferase family 117 protein [Endomicrobiales bacterium]
MKKTAAGLVLLLTFGVYLGTLVPALTGDDSGELAGAGATLGTAHSPGYPLYTLAAKAAVTALPFGNPAFRVNLVSAVFIALAALVVFLVSHGITRSTPAAAAAALTFAFSGLVWAMANVTEVYGIAAFLAALICLAVLNSFGVPRAEEEGAPPVAQESGEGGQRRWLYLASFLFGLGITAHYTLALMGPGLALWVLLKRRELLGRNGALTLLKAAAFFCAGLSAVLYLYLRARQEPLFGWEDPKTLERFWQVVARLRYGTLALAQGGGPPLSPQAIVQKLVFYLVTVYKNLTVFGALIFLAGVWAGLRKKGAGWVFFLMLAGCGPGFLIMANVGLDAASKDLLERFFFLSFLLVAVFLAQGLKIFPRRVQGLSLALPFFLLAQNYPLHDRRGEYLFYDHAKNMLRTLPRRALLFSDRADEMEFSLAYLHLAGGQRPDIEFVDCNAGVTRSIYGDDYYRIWGKPRLALRERTEKALIAGTDRPVYYATFYPDMVDIPRAQEGLLFRVKPDGKGRGGFPFDELYALRVPGGERDERSTGLVLSYHQLLGEYGLEYGRRAEAGGHFRGVLAYDESGKAAASIGFLFHRKGLRPEAKEYYRTAVEKGTAGPDVFVNLGVIAREEGDLPKAREYYDRSLRLAPDNVQARYNLAALLWEQQDWPEVVRQYEEILRREPGHAQARAYLALAKQRIRQ